MEIVVLDGYTENPGDLSWDSISELGNLTVYDRTEDKDSIIYERIKNADIVLTNKTPIRRSVIEKSNNLKMISVLATGYNVIDIEFAKKNNIIVCNVPSYGTESVAQFSIALLLEVCCHVGSHSASVKNGKWENCQDFCYWDYPLVELSEKTIGIVGFGRIGQREGRIAKALGMKVLAYDPYPTTVGQKIAEYVDLDTLYSRSDVITLHCNLTDENVGMINKKSIQKMKESVIIINNSRGQLINEIDLAEALNSDRVRAAALDVVSAEPITKNNPLLKAKNCIITPHISWASKECRERIMNTTFENIKAFLDGVPQNRVNS